MGHVITDQPAPWDDDDEDREDEDEMDETYGLEKASAWDALLEEIGRRQIGRA